VEKNKINIGTTLTRNPNQVFNEIDGEVLMLNVVNEEYYNLTGTAKIIWDILANKTTLKDIVNKLANQYEISTEDCLTDVKSFLEKLINKGIVEISNA